MTQRDVGRKNPRKNSAVGGERKGGSILEKSGRPFVRKGILPKMIKHLLA